jgi:hypothetical protein
MAHLLDLGQTLGDDTLHHDLPWDESYGHIFFDLDTLPKHP